MEKKNMRPSFVLAVCAWTYVFVTAVTTLFRVVPSDRLTWTSFGFFFVLAICASALAQGRQARLAPSDQVRINIAGQIYTGDALMIHELRDGKVVVYVDLSKPAEAAEKTRREAQKKK